MTKENYYFDADEFYKELSQYRQQLSQPDLSANAQPSNYIGQKLMELGQHLLTSKNFNGYEYALKQDMLSFGLYKAVRGLTTFKLDMQKHVFAYFTRIFYLAYLTVIGNHYKNVNLQRKLTIDKFHQLGYTDAEIEDIIGKSNLGTGHRKDYKYNKNLYTGKSKNHK